VNEAGGRIFHCDPNAVTTVLAARSGFLAENPELARRFATANEELTAWMIANPEEARRRIRNELSAITRREIPQSLVDEAWQRLHPDTSISVEPFEKFLEKAKKVGFLRAEVNLKNLIWKP
jgi:ABC-type nitrate/sulfonate/bicarbonate transport system substrate-binding protein